MISFKTSNKQLKKDIEAWCFLLPSMTIFAFVVLIPFLSVFFMSIFHVDFRSTPSFIGLKNFIDIFSHKEIYSAFFVTFKYTVIHIFFTTILSLTIALMFNAKLYGIGIIRTMYIAPFVVNSVAIIIVFMAFYSSDSMFNDLIRSLGIEPPIWLIDNFFAIPAVALPFIWQSIGFYSIIFLSALQNIPKELYESSYIDGANSWKRFHKIVFPLISPTTFLIIVVMSIWDMKVFTELFVMYSTGGIPSEMQSLVSLLYNKAFIYNDFSYAAAIGVIVFVVSIVLTVLQRMGEKRWVHYN